MLRVLSAVLALSLSAGAQSAVPVGTIALYSDGRVEKLIADDERGLLWEDDRKRQYLRSRNPAMPTLESRQIISGKSYTQKLSSGDPDSLKEQPLGTPVYFRVVRYRDGSAKTRNWRCSYLGSASEEVLGQMRTLDRYQCERYAISNRFNNRIVRDEREFTYSPELGVKVDFQRKTSTRNRTRQLVALFEPGKTDRKTLTRAVRKLRAD